MNEKFYAKFYIGVIRDKVVPRQKKTIKLTDIDLVIGLTQTGCECLFAQPPSTL